MSVIKNKASLNRFYREVMSKGNLDVIDKLLSKDFVERNPLPGQKPGSAGLKKAMGEFRAAFPDMHVKVEQMIGEKNMVAVRVTYGGTHKGEFAGMKPTNKKFKVMGMDFVRFSTTGKVKEHWSSDDANLSMMQQLGVIPPM